MPSREARETARRTKAQESSALRDRQNTERMSAQAKERQAQEAKIARLRELRLAQVAPAEAEQPSVTPKKRQR
jgi:hypothetical protein